MKAYRKRLLQVTLMLLLFGCCSQAAFSQQGTITGIVKSAAGEVLSGATVAIKESGQATITDGNGNFSIIAKAGNTLVVSSIGYNHEEVRLSGEEKGLTILLQTANQKMNEVVVIGYQSASRKSVTTAISSLGAKEVQSYVSGNVANAIQGKLPGVQVFSGNGLPGSQPTILIRGLSSLTQNTTPLVIVDGIEIGYNNLNFINPMDVENIDVLKDASASAIYGSRAGQGVILITTKKGRGKTTINAETSVGLDYLPDPGLADGQEYMRIMNRIAKNSGVAPYFPDTNIPSYNHWKDAFDVGVRQNYFVSASGSKEGVSYYGSLGYYKQSSYNATDRGGNWQKISARFNLDWAINKVIKIGFNIAPRYEKWLGSPNVTFNAAAMDPTTAPFKTEDSVRKAIAAAGLTSTYATAFDPYYSQFNRSSFNGVDVPLATFARNFDNNDVFGTQYATYMEVKPLQNLVLKTMFEGFQTTNTGTDYTPKYFIASNNNVKQEKVSQNIQTNFRWKITNTANYKVNLRDHHFDLLAGQSADNYTVKGNSVSKTGIPFELEPYRYVSSATTILDGGGYYQSGAAPFGRMLSYFGSLRYNFRDRYFLSGSMRTDGSSLVNPAYRWGYFPTLSAAWVISEERFLKNTSNLNFLKLRASWGRAGGNLPGSVGAYLTTVAPVLYTDANGGVVTGRLPNYIADPEIKWEVQEDYTVGMDAALFNNKLNVSLEGYMRKPQDLLIHITVDPVLGYPQGYIATQLSNAGNLTTKGIDLNLGYKATLTKKISVGADLVVSHWKSTVENVGNADPVRYRLNNDVITTFRSRLTKGHIPGAWFGYYVDGVFQTDAEAASYQNKDGQALQPLAKAGDLKYRDVNGDGKIDEKDLSDLGSPYPDLTAGLTLRANYGPLDFRIEMYSAFGHSYANDYRLLMQGISRYNFISGLGDKFWDGPGTSNTFPTLRTQDPNGNFSKMSTFLLEKANFLRCRVVQVGYTIPSDRIKGVKSLRVYVTAQNLFVLTKYSGLNPDLPFQDIGLNGIDRYQAIPPQSFLFGVSFNL